VLPHGTSYGKHPTVQSSASSMPVPLWGSTPKPIHVVVAQPGHFSSMSSMTVPPALSPASPRNSARRAIIPTAPTIASDAHRSPTSYTKNLAGSGNFGFNS
jgi:hypothetical protein